MNDNITGMARSGGHTTSVAAARGVRRETLKSLVMQAARDAGPFGLIDEDLLAIDPTRPESSFRKRRTELTQAGWIIDAGYDRKNRHGQASAVYVHRDHWLNPPPLGAAAKLKKLTAEEERAAIVKWLRNLHGSHASKWLDSARCFANSIDEIAARDIAIAIAAGEHLK